MGRLSQRVFKPFERNSRIEIKICIPAIGDVHSVNQNWQMCLTSDESWAIKSNLCTVDYGWQWLPLCLIGLSEQTSLSVNKEASCRKI